VNWVEPIRSKKKIAEIEANLKEHRPRDYLLFVFGMRVALRISDLLSLKVKDVIDEDGAIRDALIIIEKKTKKRRIIQLNVKSKEALTWYFESTGIKNDNAFLFPSQKGGAIGRHQALRLVKGWCTQVGLAGDYGTHSLRKTWAWLAWKNGGDIATIREALGHSREEITLRYVGISTKDVSALYDLVDLDIA